MQDAGAVSDFFSGAITPFFTLAAFFLLLGSYNLQKQELQLNRDEMQKSADALKNQYEIMKSEKKAADSQREFNLFIKLLERWENTKVDIKIEIHTSINVYQKVELNDFFNLLGRVLFRCKEWCGLENEKDFIWGEYSRKSKFIDRVNNVIRNVAYNYYANLYIILSHIDNMSDYKTKYLALECLSTSLSHEEKIILRETINNNVFSLIKNDVEFKKLAEKYKDYIYFKK